MFVIYFIYKIINFVSIKEQQLILSHSVVNTRNNVIRKLLL